MNEEDTSTSPEKALQNLRDQKNDFETLNVLMSAEREGHPSGYEARRFKTNTELRDRLREVIHETITYTEDSVIQPYDPGYNPESHEILYLKTQEEEELKAFRSHLTTISDIPDFDEDDEGFADDLNFYGLVGVPAEEEPAIFCRKPYRKKDLAVDAGRRSGIRAIFGSSDRYQPFEQKVFHFDGQVDFFLWGGYFFILNPNHFHYVIGKFQKMKDRVDEYVDDLKTKLPDGLQIGNEAEFREACANDSRMAKKLHQVVNRPYWNGDREHAVTVEKIKEVIKQFNLSEEERIQFDGTTLKFNTSPTQRWTLLKLLDDDYLGSAMTGRKYETNSKLDVSGE
jgi:hypothetical protein